MAALGLMDALDRAVEEFRSRLVRIGNSNWESPTPCSDWDVRNLVAHVVGGNRFASYVLGGATSDVAMSAVMSQQQLGPSPVDNFELTADKQRKAFSEQGALQRAVSHPLGDISGARFLGMRVFDILLHAWDLATASSFDATLRDDVVETVLAIVEEGPDGIGFGIVARGEFGADAPPLHRLLDLAGRSRH